MPMNPADTIHMDAASIEQQHALEITPPETRYLGDEIILKLLDCLMDDFTIDASLASRNLRLVSKSTRILHDFAVRGIVIGACRSPLFRRPVLPRDLSTFVNVLTIKISGANAVDLSIDLTSISTCPNLKYLGIIGSFNCEACFLDLTPISACPKLESLEISCSFNNKDGILDLTPVTTCPVLKTLYLNTCCCQGDHVIDLTPVSACSTLESLHLEDCGSKRFLMDLTPIASSSALKTLVIINCRVKNISALVSCVALESVMVSTNLFETEEEARAFKIKNVKVQVVKLT